MEQEEQNTKNNDMDIRQKKIEALLKENIKLTKALQKQTKRISRRITLLSLGGYLRWLVVLVPLIIGVIYLPSYLTDKAAEIFHLDGIVPTSSPIQIDQVKGILDKLTPEQGEQLQKILER